MTTGLRHLATLLTVLVCATALAVPAPASAAGGRLSVAEAKEVAFKYAAEICAADAPRCKSYKIGKCARLSPKKVACRTFLQRKQGVTCTYKVTLKKVAGDVQGRVGRITCS